MHTILRVYLHYIIYYYKPKRKIFIREFKCSKRKLQITVKIAFRYNFYNTLYVISIYTYFNPVYFSRVII